MVWNVICGDLCNVAIDRMLSPKVSHVRTLGIAIPFASKNALSPNMLKSQSDTTDTSKQVNKLEIGMLIGDRMERQ